MTDTKRYRAKCAAVIFLIVVADLALAWAAASFLASSLKAGTGSCASQWTPVLNTDLFCPEQPRKAPDVAGYRWHQKRWDNLEPEGV